MFCISASVFQQPLRDLYLTFSNFGIMWFIMSTMLLAFLSPIYSLCLNQDDEGWITLTINSH